MREPAFLPTVLRGLRPGHPAPSRQTDASSAETIPERWRWAPGGDLGGSGSWGPPPLSSGDGCGTASVVAPSPPNHRVRVTAHRTCWRSRGGAGGVTGRDGGVIQVTFEGHLTPSHG